MPHATDRHPGSFDALAPLVLHQAFDAPMGLGNTAHTHTHTHTHTRISVTYLPLCDQQGPGRRWVGHLFLWSIWCVLLKCKSHFFVALYCLCCYCGTGKVAVVVWADGFKQHCFNAFLDRVILVRKEKEEKHIKIVVLLLPKRTLTPPGFRARRFPYLPQQGIYHSPDSPSPHNSWCGDSWSPAYLKKPRAICF